MRCLLTATLLALTAPAAAQCRPATDADLTTAHGWSVHAEDVSIGRCGADAVWCFVIDQTLCETSTDEPGEATGSIEAVGEARVLVLRWTTAETEGTDRITGGGTELWRIDGAPRRLLAVLEGWREVDANMVRTEPRVVCSILRTLEIGADGVVIGAVRSFRRCAHRPPVERRGARALGPTAHSYTWDALLGRHPPR